MSPRETRPKPGVTPQRPPAERHPEATTGSADAEGLGEGSAPVGVSPGEPTAVKWSSWRAFAVCGLLGAGAAVLAVAWRNRRRRRQQGKERYTHG
jgi:hypothetical protein